MFLFRIGRHKRDPLLGAEGGSRAIERMDQPVSHLKAKQDEIKMKKQQRRDDRISIVKLPFYQSLKKPEGENFFIDVEMVMAFTSKLKYDLYHQEKKRIQSIRPKLSNEQIKLHLKNFTNKH